MKLKMSIQRKKLRELRKFILIFYFICSNFNYNIKYFKVTLYYMTELTEIEKKSTNKKVTCFTCRLITTWEL